MQWNSISRSLLIITVSVGFLSFLIIFVLITNSPTLQPPVIPEAIIPQELTESQKEIPKPQPKETNVQPSSYTSSTQFVLLAFDGSRSLSMWRDTLAFADSLSALTQYPVRFTYFISGVYLVSADNKQKYTSPGGKQGASLIGFGTTEDEVLRRMKLIYDAQTRGHEIASHANGHFNGAPWSYEDWQAEFEQFHTIISDPIAYNNFTTSTPWIDVGQVSGFRAPNLGVNKEMFALLPQFGFTYDTSITSTRMDALPSKNAQGLWQFYLPMISRGNGKRVLAMDYNFFVAHTDAKDLVSRTDPRWQELHDDMLTAYRAYFKHNYNGNRAPVYIGHHFSLWNSDVYYEVFKDFAREVCVQPDVACVTYRELVSYLNTQQVTQ